MSDFLKSAFNYFNADVNSANDDFVGQIVEVGALKLRIKSKIAEGGFAYVYEAQDVSQGTLYALKRLFGADKEACNNIIQEINIHKQISSHPNIVKFITASFVDRTKSANGLAEYLLVTELCTGGSLIEYINDAIDSETVLKIIYQAASAIQHLHNQNPAIIHRDIKVENFLLGSDSMLKLCDFGSATNEIIVPDPNWNVSARNELEEKLAVFTTPMYRAPEQLDTWSNFTIGPKTDIWALGCILYCLCYQKHPFDDCAKLRIINANYTIPQNSNYNCYHTVIKGCLQINPDNRFDVSRVLENLAVVAETLHWNPKGPIHLKPKSKQQPTSICSDNNIADLNNTPHTSASQQPPHHHLPPERPEPPRSARFPPPQQPLPQQQPPPPLQNAMPSSSNGLFSSIKGGAGSFFKNLKDTSSKVMQTVQQTITKTDIDVTYITTRIMVMPCPSEGLESAYKLNHIENIKYFLESKYQLSKVSVYNFGPRSSPRLLPPIRTVEGSVIYCPAPPRAPSLRGLFNIVEDMYGFLNADPKNVVIIQSNDGARSVAATIVAALFVYGHLIKEPEDGIQMFAVKRAPLNMRASELRYLYYLTDIVRSTPHFPHFKPITLINIMITPVPRMTKARDGCRLFVEITCNDKVVLSTLEDYECMRLYHCTEETIKLPLNIAVCGDLCVSLYHARNTLVGMGGRPHGIKICQFQLNTGFVPEEETLLSYGKHDLDEITEVDHFLTNLNVSMSILVSSEENPPPAIPPWISTKNKSRNATILFGSELEYQENLENFVTTPITRPPKSPQPIRPPAPKPARPTAPPSPLLHSDNRDVGEHHQHNIQPDLVQNILQAERNPSPTQHESTFDLLNLNQNTENRTSQQPFHHEPPVRPPPPQKLISFDLLGFERSEETPVAPSNLADVTTQNDVGEGGTGRGGMPIDLLGNTSSANSTNLLGNLNLNLNDMHVDVKPTSQSFDPFNSLLQPNVSQPHSRNSPETSQQPSGTSASNADPFADLGSFVNFSKNDHTKPAANQAQNIFTGGGAQPNVIPTPSPSTSTHTTPTHQNRSAQENFSQQAQQQSQSQQKPDYNRLNFADPKDAGKNNGGSKPPGGFGDIFADILGEQGYKFGSKDQGPRTINDMRKEDIVRDMDPDRIKIMEWTEGKKGNIRALLCSMHSILWAEAKWTKCEMHQLVSMADVKKAYRKACLAVHPDKHVNTENEDLSKMIFVELNNAWSDFEDDSKQHNMF